MHQIQWVRALQHIVLNSLLFQLSYRASHHLISSSKSSQTDSLQNWLLQGARSWFFYWWWQIFEDFSIRNKSFNQFCQTIGKMTGPCLVGQNEVKHFQELVQFEFLSKGDRLALSYGFLDTVIKMREPCHINLSLGVGKLSHQQSKSSQYSLIFQKYILENWANIINCLVEFRTTQNGQK